MGCAGSKLDNLEAVALCRDRSQFLESAIRHRYALASAHVSYLKSLKQVGLSLEHFFEIYSSSSPSSSPVLPLPTHRKGDPIVHSPSPPIPIVHHSHSNSGSHLHFHSDSDADDDDDGSLHLSDEMSPFHDQETPDRFVHMNYMRNQPPAPAVTYEQRPQSPETIHHVGESSYGYSYPANPNPNPNFYPSYYPYPSSYSSYGGIGNFFGSPPQYASSSFAPPSFSSPPPQAAAPDAASSSRPPPPPPSPPRASTWDFLNFFGASEPYYPAYTPSRDSKEVREEEGIPDLEDEEYQQEVVKEVHGDQKFVAGTSVGVGGGYYNVAGDENERVKGGEKGGVEYEVPMVEKTVHRNVDRSEEDRGNVAQSRRSRAVFDVVREIKAQFDRASDSADEVSKLLEVGILPYQRKSAVYEAVSSKMLNVMAPSPSSVVSSSQPSTSKIGGPSSSTGITGNVDLEIDEELAARLQNLSTTLEKLYVWEKKLYEEVKAEEKLRIDHDKKCRRLKRLDERGAEAHKVEATRILIRDLSTKIGIAIQGIETVSNKINKLRDEELWPQISALIRGFIRMWKVMLECHQSQHQAIAEAKNMDAIASNIKFSDAHVKAIEQLEMELLSWTCSFYNWISAQKSFVKSLNDWLLRCLHYEPEETADGIAPFSPGRLGAPLVFVICNQWSQVLDRISEKEVTDAMKALGASVFVLRDQHNMQQRQNVPKMGGNKDTEKKLKLLVREEQRIQKERNKKLALVPGDDDLHLQIPTASSGSLHSGLRLTFEAMEKFTADSLKAYEELHIRSEEDRLAKENAKVP